MVLGYQKRVLSNDDDSKIILNDQIGYGEMAPRERHRVCYVWKFDET